MSIADEIALSYKIRVLGYVGGADTTSQTPITVTIQTTLGELREAKRALWVANIEAPKLSLTPSEREAT